MNNEILTLNANESESMAKPAKAETINFDDTKKMAEESKANNAELSIAKKQDALESDAEYKKIQSEILGLKSPEEATEAINTKLKALEKELEEKNKDYTNLTTSASYSNGVGGVSFVGGTEAAAFSKKYKGVDKIVDLLALATDKNKEKKSEEKADGILGLLGAHKKSQEINNREFITIKNVLTTGEIGTSNLDGEAILQGYKTVIAFLAENDPELLKTEKYQDMLTGVCKHDEEANEKYGSLIVKDEETIDRPTSVKDAMDFEKTVDQINEFETQKSQVETKYKKAA
ncbi:MAG: hypothetical protein WCN88_02295 [Candidatus Falkowbacteria bacterium]